MHIASLCMPISLCTHCRAAPSVVCGSTRVTQTQTHWAWCVFAFLYLLNWQDKKRAMTAHACVLSSLRLPISQNSNLISQLALSHTNPQDPQRKRAHSSMYKLLRTNLPRHIMGFRCVCCVCVCVRACLSQQVLLIAEGSGLIIQAILASHTLSSLLKLPSLSQ